MIEWLRTDNARVVRYAIVGLTATVLHYAVYLLIVGILPPWLAYTVGYAISFCCNYCLTNVFTFRTRPSVQNGIGFALSHIVNYLLHIVLLQLFLWISIPEAWAPVPIFAIVIPVNYLLLRFVFIGSRKTK